MESVHRKISQTMRNFVWCAKFIFAASYGFVRCAKFCTVCEIGLYSVLQLLLLLISHAMRNFCIDMRNCYMLDFFLWFSSLHLWLAWQPIAKLGKGLWSAPKLGFFLYLSFNLHCHGLHKFLPHSLLVSMIKKRPKLARNWLVTLARFLNVPIELKSINYYLKVFKIINFKL